MNIVIWGNGELGKQSFRLIDKENCCVKAFADSNSAFVGTVVSGIPVISYNQLKDMSNNERVSVLLALRNSYNIITVLQKLDNCNIEDIGIIKPRILAKGSPITIDYDEEIGDIVWVKRKEKIYKFIPRLELNIVDGCNLNCRGCSHFSNLFSKDSIYQIEEYEKDLQQIRKIGKMVRLRLLGGEPFLVKNLGEYLSLARRIFPEADIELVTNGLLIPKIGQEILEAMRVNNIFVNISQYKPTLKIKVKIEKILGEARIWYKFEEGDVDEFSKKLTLEKKHDGKLASINCLSKGCIFLRKGMLYKCPLEGLAFILEKKYSIKFDVAERGINIYEGREKVYNDMLDLIINPVEMCQYCSKKNDRFKWKIENNPILQDWIYGLDD